MEWSISTDKLLVASNQSFQCISGLNETWPLDYIVFTQTRMIPWCKHSRCFLATCILSRDLQSSWFFGYNCLAPSNCELIWKCGISQRCSMSDQWCKLKKEWRDMTWHDMAWLLHTPTWPAQPAWMIAWSQLSTRQHSPPRLASLNSHLHLLIGKWISKAAAG